MGNNSLLFESIFNRKLSEADTTAYLADITKEYPYFSPAQYFLLSKLDNQSPEYDKQVGKTALLFNNPYWLNFLLMEENTGSIIQENSFGETDKYAEVREQQGTWMPVSEQADVYNNVETGNTNYQDTPQDFIEDNMAFNSQPSLDLTPEISSNIEEIAGLPSPIIEEPSLSSFNIDEKESVPSIEEPVSSFDITEPKELEATQSPSPVSMITDEEQVAELLDQSTETDTDNEEELSSPGQESIDISVNEEENDLQVTMEDQTQAYAETVETPTASIETEEKVAAEIPENLPVASAELVNDTSGGYAGTAMENAGEPEKTYDSAVFQREDESNLNYQAEKVPPVAGIEGTERDDSQVKHTSHFNNDDTPLENEAETESSIQETTPLNFKLNIDTSNVTEEDITFEPLHTSDYFASQGIKLSAEIQPSDKLGKQLKSFTEWLKTMKKIHSNQLSAQNGQVESSIQKLAENSNKQDEVLTESMAEVLVQQGKTSKAAEVYKKLSLLDTSKSAYFAAKIDQLKEQ